MALIEKGGALGKQEFAVVLSAGTVSVKLGNSIGVYDLQWDVAVTVSGSTWTHVAVTWDGATSGLVSLYIDGVQIAQTSKVTAMPSGAVPATPASVLLGASRDLVDVKQKYFHGYMDEIYVFGTREFGHCWVATSKIGISCFCPN